MQLSKDYFLELLQIRYSSPLFRLPHPAHIKQQLYFHNTGPSQVVDWAAMCICCPIRLL